MMKFPTQTLIENFFNVGIGGFNNAVGNLISGLFHNCGSTLASCSQLAPKLPTQLYGIDIPVLIPANEEKQSEKLVVILGQDPYRNPTDQYFKTAGAYINNPYMGGTATIIGTPYAYHLTNSIKPPSVIKYSATQFMADLIGQIHEEKGYDVYLTDLSKLFACGHTINQMFGKRKNPGFEDNSLCLLKKELDCLRAMGYSDIVVLCSGKYVHKRVQTTVARKLNFFYHFTSGRALGYWKKQIGSSSSVDKINHIVSKI